jgi:hypothetical protein
MLADPMHVADAAIDERAIRLFQHNRPEAAGTPEQRVSYASNQLRSIPRYVND